MFESWTKEVSYGGGYSIKTLLLNPLALNFEPHSILESGVFPDQVSENKFMKL